MRDRDALIADALPIVRRVASRPASLLPLACDQGWLEEAA
jgi:hypothetical protein